jgi:hypothetical protein
LNRYKRAAGKEIAVGFPKGKGQAYPDGETVIEAAAKNCFGIGVPKRDFMGEAQDAIHQATKPIMKRIAQAVNEDKAKAVNALTDAAGMVAADQIKKTIRDGAWVPNSPTTVARKGSSKPLIDTGHMIQSVTYVVREKE